MLEPAIRRKPVDQANVYGRPTSSSRHSAVYSNPSGGVGAAHGVSPSQNHLAHPQHFNPQSRRSPSVNTFSTASSIPPPAAYRNSSVSDLRRSTSSRSGGSPQPSGYVALLRKQKATVWCDRAQYEDPRLAAQQRAARQRANQEVSGGRSRASLKPGSRSNTGISATGKVAAKIRHHGKSPVVGLTPGENHVGVGGVPLRLSATEVEAESSDDESNLPSASRLQHRSTGSSRSSQASGMRGVSGSGPNNSYRTSGGHGSMTSRNSQRWADTPSRPGSMSDSQAQLHGPGQFVDEDAVAVAASRSETRSTHSANSDGEKADNVAELGGAPRLASNSLLHSALTREKSVKNPEELRRRGSVDERTATLTSQRLYIANPD
ncbi:hypothetical protein GMORB2_3032 [Geosmithia morbida]|uniref:Uncharacterized protein n=1 Tax=Geosmithia morbida TaxID=1094350 RepID=A0A9P4YRS5_9HYPO|nr:uncharacterized protein GMORB2_3032 [Geosmithia morbida]KAF4120594.1 hypothetical protein GMORB2_3032 [Geosmithia morbida]